MSIIYEALRKSQQARAAKAPLAIARKPKLQRKNLIIMLLILTCLFMIIATFTLTGISSLKLPMLGQKVKIQPAILASAPRLMLEGVFLSDTEKLAMINHHAYHEGDNISGMQVVSIAFDEVQLRSKSRSITLRSALTQLD